MASSDLPFCFQKQTIPFSLLLSSTYFAQDTMLGTGGTKIKKYSYRLWGYGGLGQADKSPRGSSAERGGAIAMLVSVLREPEGPTSLPVPLG